MSEERTYKVMILYASYGEGHYQVAKALSEKFHENGVQDVKLVDLFKKAHPTLNAITRYFYIKSYNVMPAVYGWLYYGTKHIKWDSFLAKWLQSYGIHTLMEMLEAEEPDIVIHTFPMSVVPEICKKTGRYLPSVTVVTDFDLHRRWVHPSIDRYYVATEELKEKIQGAGIPSDRICVSGIPVKAAFERSLPAEEILRKYALDHHRRTVLIMAGSYGVMQGLGSVCDRIAMHDEVQVILVCGKNNMLISEMQSRFQATSNVKVMGFVEQIHELMQISSCIVTKPGGITLSEAIMMKLPILIYRPVPGQEKDNARFLQRRGAAHIAHEPKELEQQILRLLQDPSHLASMQREIIRLRKPQAAEVIVHDILEYLSSGNFHAVMDEV